MGACDGNSGFCTGSGVCIAEGVLPQQRPQCSPSHSPCRRACTRGPLSGPVRASEAAPGSGSHLCHHTWAGASLTCVRRDGGHLGQGQGVGGELLPLQNKERGGVSQAMQRGLAAGFQGPGGHTLCVGPACGLPGARLLQGRTERWEGAPGEDKSRADRPAFSLQNTRYAESWPWTQPALNGNPCPRPWAHSVPITAPLC